MQGSLPAGGARVRSRSPGLPGSAAGLGARRSVGSHSEHPFPRRPRQGQAQLGLGCVAGPAQEAGSSWPRLPASQLQLKIRPGLGREGPAANKQPGSLVNSGALVSVWSVRLSTPTPTPTQSHMHSCPRPFAHILPSSPKCLSASALSTSSSFEHGCSALSPRQPSQTTLPSLSWPFLYSLPF